MCLFVRVSSQKQDYDRQIFELTEYCKNYNYIISKTIATQVTGTKTAKDRPDLQELFIAANKKEFDKVLVSEISRIGRNAKDIRNTIDYLHNRNIPIVFKNLGGLQSIDDSGKESFVTNIIISIYSELAQEEKRILSERIKSGLQNAYAKGKIKGRPTGTNKTKTDLLKTYSKLADDLQKSFSLNQCIKLHNVSKNTVIKIKRVLPK